MHEDSRDRASITKPSLIIWDDDSAPPTGFETTILWRRYADDQNPNIISIPALVEKNAGVLKSQYLAWIHDLGELKIDGQRVIDHLTIRPGLSYWWMSSAAQKFNVSGVSYIDDAIKALAFETLLQKKSAASITLCTANKQLASCIESLSRKKGINYQWRRAQEPPKNKSVRDLYRCMPHILQTCIYLAWYSWKNARLLFGKKKVISPLKGQVLFVDVLVHLDKRSILNGSFISNYWTSLVDKITTWEISPNWLHSFFRHPAVPTITEAQTLIDRFNKSSINQHFHALIEQALSLHVLIKTLRDYFSVWRTHAQLKNIDACRPAGSDLNLWPLHADEWIDSLCGKNALLNCLRVSLFEEALSHLPPQKIGVYIAENQPWEMALIFAWKTAGHGTLIGTPHTTLRYWDLRYFYDPQSYVKNKGGLPLPDTWAVNGPVAYETILASGFPPEYIVKVEALRFLHLLKNRQENTKEHSPEVAPRILICGDFLAETNQKILAWLDIAAASMPQDTKYIFKPHPAYPLRAQDYPILKIEINAAPLSDLLSDCDVVFTSNITSAAVDAYSSGIAVVQMLDGKNLNISPLRGLQGVTHVTNPQELAEALKSFKWLKNSEEKPYFYLDATIPRWRKLLTP